MPTWPASLPQGRLLGLTDQADDAVLRTEMDAGPPTRRNRFTVTTRQLGVSLVLTGTQRQTLDTFFATTLSNGALAFDWTDPATLLTASLAFRAPPSYRLAKGGTATSRVWEARLELEVQP